MTMTKQALFDRALAVANASGASLCNVPEWQDYLRALPIFNPAPAININDMPDELGHDEQAEYEERSQDYEEGMK